MNYQLITEAPAWFLLLCFAAGLLYAGVLYRKEREFAESGPWLVRVMAALRFLSVSFLCILLLSPLIKTIFTEVEKPIVVILQDNSESVYSIRDSADFKAGYPIRMEQLRDQLSGNFDVRTYSLGGEFKEGLPFSFDGKESDLSEPVAELKARYSGRNLGAVILATDGLYNKGNNPAYAYTDLKVPVYTIGLGDTSVLKDVLIAKINHSKTVFRGNTFPVEITIDARKSAGQNTTLTISKNNKVLFSKRIEIATNRYNAIVPVFLDADENGINHYKVNLTSLDNEINYQNNSRDFYVEVNNNQQQILVVSGAPHPDIGAIKNILESNPNYKVEQVLINEFDGNLQEVNLVILYQLPAQNNPAASLISSIEKSELPVFYILGSQTGVSVFNNLATGVKINDNRNNVTEILPNPNQDFSLYSMEEENQRRIASFPPLISPFGTYQVSGNVYAMLNQKVGAVKSGMPLLWFSEQNTSKRGVLAGEGIWKWRLREHAEFGSYDAVTSLIVKTVQYLATKEKKKPLNLFYKNSYSENEPVIFDAEVYNESGELVNTNDVQIVFTNEEGKNFQYTFSKTQRAYTLNAGYLPVGVYKFTGSSGTGAGKISESGSIVISALQVELAETIADHQLLEVLSDKTGGDFYTPGQMDQLIADLEGRNDIKPVSYQQKRLTDVINLKWIFVLLMLLLSAEWFMRKRSGSY